MSCERHTVSKCHSCDCTSPIIIQVPGLQGTGILWENCTEAEKQEITQMLYDPIKEQTDKSVQIATESAAEAKASEIKVAGYAGIAEQLVPIKDAITTTAGVAEEVKTVAGIASDVTSVAGVAQDVKKVAGITTAVSNVANIATETQAVGSNIATITRANSLLSHTADLTKLSPHIGDLHRVGQDLLASDKKDMSYDFGMVSDAVETVSTVTGGILKEVADHLDDCIHPVGQKIDEVHDVAQNLATISRATGLLDHTADIAALSPHIDDLHRVGQDLLVTDAVDKSYDYGSVSDAVEPSGAVTGGILKNVSDHIKDCIHPVAQKLDDIHTVGAVAAEVTKVASIAAEVKLASEVESHITDIQAAQEHIDEIHVVGQDLQGISDPSLDYGAVAEDAHPIATITGGYIKAVAEHIEDCIHPLSLELSTVEIVAKNIDSVVKAKELLEDHKADPEGHPVATQSTAGFMSAADKTKLDGTEQFVDGSVTAAKLADTIDLGGF